MSLYPVTCTCTVTLLPVTFIPVIGEVTVMCMCLAPIGSIPLLIDMDGLGIGIGDLARPAAADVLPDEPQAAAASASALTPTATRKTEPGRKRPRDENADINGPPPVPAPLTGTITDGFEDASKDAPAAALIAHPRKGGRKRSGAHRR